MVLYNLIHNYRKYPNIIPGRNYWHRLVGPQVHLEWRRKITGPRGAQKSHRKEITNTHIDIIYMYIYIYIIVSYIYIYIVLDIYNYITLDIQNYVYIHICIYIYISFLYFIIYICIYLC